MNLHPTWRLELSAFFNLAVRLSSRLRDASIIIIPCGRFGLLQLGNYMRCGDWMAPNCLDQMGC
jgi:hypothetical protein